LNFYTHIYAHTQTHTSQNETTINTCRRKDADSLKTKTQIWYSELLTGMYRWQIRLLPSSWFSPESWDCCSL